MLERADPDAGTLASLRGPHAAGDRFILVGSRRNQRKTAAEAIGERWAKDLYLGSGNTADPLHPASSKYITRAEHAVAPGRQLSEAGRGGAHPYLPNVALPR